jgi:hypothetical protein
MAVLHPSTSFTAGNEGGYFRELDVLERLRQSLPDSYEIFHHLDWQTIHQNQDRHGELDVVVMAPNGNLLLIEIKAGEVILRNGEIFKRYTSGEHDVGRQCRVQYAAMVNRLQEFGQHPLLINCLVLPDYVIGHAQIIAFPRERIIDAHDYDQLGSLARRFLEGGSKQVDIDGLRHFLKNEFRVTTDLAVLRDQILNTTCHLADGLATWGSRITSPSGVVRVQATAGSGKTQLALRLMEDATQTGQSVLFACFNRTLADHVSRLAPTRAVISNFHELAVDHYRRRYQQPDFTDPTVFNLASQTYLSDSATFPAKFDLLIIDEGQDFEPTWVESLLAQLKPDGKLYLFEDEDQRLYERETFDLDNAVILTCRDNFRTPKAVCEVINAFGLTSSSVVGRSPYIGHLPGFHVYDTDSAMAKLTAQVIEQLLQEGFGLQDIVVLSGHGRNKSILLNSAAIGSFTTRSFTGKYSSDGEPIWSTGDLLVESVFRFKGQSAPVVVMTEIDFTELTDLERRKLFVGMTRAHMRVEMVISKQAEACFSILLAV